MLLCELTVFLKFILVAVLQLLRALSIENQQIISHLYYDDYKTGREVETNYENTEGKPKPNFDPRFFWDLDMEKMRI